MRLSCIKLAGFKSFVEPTTVTFPSQLCAIVGPNGCGKSNIIDAVRWVMGESSAKNLRGESSTDVIFNGSTSRKPIGQASIELVFDNDQGKLTGEYANYREISIKRKVTRDGVSTYYLNNTKCRRRDITDIFLGTGLGPRSYAIIEQGMISRLIEAKPEELRHYLEEAAGISKYKERRRETENRMTHTRENLDRLNDLREELDRHLQTLQRQASAAEKYKILKQEQSLAKSQLSGLKWQQLDREKTELQQTITRIQVNIEEKVAKQRQIEADIEKERQDFSATQDNLNVIQGEYYRIGAEIAKLEQNIEHQRERQQQLELDLEQVEKGKIAAEKHLAEDQQHLTSANGELAELQPKLSIATTQENSDGHVLTELDEKIQNWQQLWDDFNQTASSTLRTAEVEQANMQHAERAIDQLESRIKILLQTRSELSPFNESALLAEDQKIQDIEKKIAAFASEKQKLMKEVAEQQSHRHRLQQDMDQLKSAVQKLQGRFASIEALQQQHLNQSNNTLIEWLNANGFADADRFFSKLSVASGWEKAVEVILENYLEAIYLNDLSLLENYLDKLPAAKLVFYEDSPAVFCEVIAPFPSIASVIQAEINLPKSLANIYLADSVHDALLKRQQLPESASFITKEGHWIGSHWVILHAEKNENGILFRKQLLADLEQQIQRVNVQLDERENLLKVCVETIQQHETSLNQLMLLIQNAQKELAEHQALRKAKLSQKSQVETQQQRNQQELEMCQNELANHQNTLNKSKFAWQEALSLVEIHAGRREELLAQKEAFRIELETLRQQYKRSRDAKHELALRMQELQAKKEAYVKNIERLLSQTESLAQRKTEIILSLQQYVSPAEDLSATLKEKLSMHVASESKLKTARQQFEAINHRLREFEEERLRVEQEVTEIRESLNRQRLDLQTLTVKQATIEEQLQEQEFSIQTVLANLSDAMNIDELAESLEEINRKIQRLGAINLAAIDELSVETDRKKYLDEQYNDLMVALQTLEEAIQKIDRETKALFKETFEIVNKNLSQLFPKVFGGGHAELVMMENDFLHTGIELIARPPGKRNTTIHLLSGGEKALTAIALIFAIFELNPSPFCMLDEVDAPLDDFNVGRYANLIREMSSRVQFIFITHNKVTMEAANQLMGVTMHEPGVSRIVAVDVEEAASMAAA